MIPFWQQAGERNSLALWNHPLRIWNPGILEYLNHKILEFWNLGLLEWNFFIPPICTMCVKFLETGRSKEYCGTKASPPCNFESWNLLILEFWNFGPSKLGMESVDSIYSYHV